MIIKQITYECDKCQKKELFSCDKDAKDWAEIETPFNIYILCPFCYMEYLENLSRFMKEKKETAND
jgi:hypothetical protein